MTDPTEMDDLMKYRTFVEAMERFVANNSGRWVRPGVECWPDDVQNRQDAIEYYGTMYADEIIEHWIDAVEATIEEDDR